MKRMFLKTAVLSLLAAAIVALPAPARAQSATNAPATKSHSSKERKHDHSVFSGKLSAIDKDAMTLTVGKRTFAITSTTKITKDGQPATLSDGVVGEKVAGAYKKDENGKLTAISIHFGVKSGSEKSKKKTTDSAGN
jgi:hypothetical protein